MRQAEQPRYIVLLRACDADPEGPYAQVRVAHVDEPANRAELEAAKERT